MATCWKPVTHIVSRLGFWT